MKKFLKNNIKLILVFLLGIIVSSGITAYAVNNYMSEQIRYQNNTFAINSVSEALDDLYSYSKEKIDNYTSNNYSTEEQVVGTWIDGKPLYQKTFAGTIDNIASNKNGFAGLIEGDKTLVLRGSTGTIQYSSSETITATIGGYRVSYSASDIQQAASTGNIYLVVRNLDSVTMTNINYIATIQYTKTTDTATS